MQLYIPSIGDSITIMENIEVNIIEESVNINFIGKLKRKSLILNDNPLDKTINGCSFTLPKNTQLIIDRIHIRKGNSSTFNNVTFSTKIGSFLHGRFLLSAEQVNKIKFKKSKEKAKTKEKHIHISKKYSKCELPDLCVNLKPCVSFDIKYIYSSIFSNIKNELLSGDMTANENFSEISDIMDEMSKEASTKLGKKESLYTIDMYPFEGDFTYRISLSENRNITLYDQLMKIKDLMSINDGDKFTPGYYCSSFPVLSLLINSFLLTGYPGEASKKEEWGFYSDWDIMANSLGSMLRRDKKGIMVSDIDLEDLKVKMNYLKRNSF